MRLGGAGYIWVPAAGEGFILKAGRDPLSLALEQRVVDFCLFCDWELHRHPDGVLVVALQRLVPLDDIDHPVLLCRNGSSCGRSILALMGVVGWGRCGG